MGSGYYGEMNMVNDQRRNGPSSSSRKGRKNSSEKLTKQPQRGLGVAQLEKIRLHGEMGFQHHHHLYPNLNTDDHIRMQTDYSSHTSSSFSYSSSPSYASHPNFTTQIGEYERTNFRYGESQPTTAKRWEPSNTFVETQHFGQQNMARHLFNPQVQDSMQNSKYGNDSIGSSSYNSESSETQELDLELRLSI